MQDDSGRGPRFMDDDAGRVSVEWDAADVPGAPLLLLVITTRGAAPLYLPAASGLDMADQVALGRHAATLLHQMADQLDRELSLVAAVDDAMIPGGGQDGR